MVRTAAVLLPVLLLLLAGPLVAHAAPRETASIDLHLDRNGYVALHIVADGPGSWGARLNASATPGAGVVAGVSWLLRAEEGRWVEDGDNWILLATTKDRFVVVQAPMPLGNLLVDRPPSAMGGGSWAAMGWQRSTDQPASWLLVIATGTQTAVDARFTFESQGAVKATMTQGGMWLQREEDMEGAQVSVYESGGLVKVPVGAARGFDGVKAGAAIAVRHTVQNLAFGSLIALGVPVVFTHLGPEGAEIPQPCEPGPEVVPLRCNSHIATSGGPPGEHVWRAEVHAGASRLPLLLLFVGADVTLPPAPG